MTISASPSSAAVARGQAGQFAVRITETGASDAVALSCSNLPAGASCSFAPSSLTPNAQGTMVALTISTSGTTAALRPPSLPAGARRYPPLFAFWMPGVIGLVMLPGLFQQRLRRSGRTRWPSRAKPQRWRWRSTLLMLAMFIALLQLACGGGGLTKASSAQSPTTPTTTTTSSSNSTTYTITVTAVSGAVTRSTNLALTLQ